ncbi:MAG: Rpn family recombination-promoting nuclease/putative transposase [Cyanothece sp. SIO1E1]|nr:Rpn family recombination-promoting nuclease/putative transposase [Cyanothece sp. SIO1E1]
MFDTVCKFLAETFAADFATWLLGETIALSELSPSELSFEPIRADALILLKSAEKILHLEFQVSPDPNMAFRMADYRLRVYRRFPHKEMRQVVIYLQPTQSKAVYQTRFEIPGLCHEFEVIRLWEQSPSSFLNRSGLLPFAVLAQTQNRPELLRQVATQIESIPEPWAQSHVAASTAILAGLVLDKGLIQQVLRRELMRESVIYQEIKAEGRQEGLLEGRRQEGVALIRRQLTHRLGALPDVIQAQLAVLSLVQIESLSEALLDFVALTDLESWLTRQREEVARILKALAEQSGELEATIQAEVQTLSLGQLEKIEALIAKGADPSELQVWLQAQKRKEDENLDS